MLAQVKKVMVSAAGGDFAGRFGAWWNGKDYAPPAPDSEEAKSEAEAVAKKAKPEAKAPEKPAAKAEEKPEAKPEAKAEAKPEPVKKAAPEVVDAFEAATPEPQPAGDSEIRIKALETLWGEGRLAPGSIMLDAQLLDAVLDQTDKQGDVGFIGVDGALLSGFASRSERKALAAEWRPGCLTRVKELAPKADITACDIDRPRSFAEHSLEGVVSFEAFAYADHKAGLVGRVYRSLTGTGRWVFLDTTRTTKKTPPEAFASAWAEPQLATADEIEELLTLAGFGSVQKLPMTGLVLQAAREGYAQLSQVLENATQSGLAGREGARFLQELAWEAQSWRARMRALEGGALEVNLWVACKGEAPLDLTHKVLPDDLLDLAAKPDDAGASDALFDQAAA